MESGTDLLCRVIAFECVKGYGIHGGKNTLHKTIPADQVDFVIKYGDWDEVS